MLYTCILYIHRQEMQIPGPNESGIQSNGLMTMFYFRGIRKEGKFMAQYRVIKKLSKSPEKIKTL